MRKSISIPYVLYCIFVILVIYQDSPLSTFLGAAGYSMVMPLSLIVFTVVMFVNKCQMYNFNEVKGFWLLGIWLIFVSVLGIIIWLLFGGKFTVLNEILPVKAFKVWLQYISFPAFIYLILYWAGKIKKIDLIFRPIIFTMVILTLLCIIEKTQIPYAFQQFHFAGGHKPYWRIRLLTTESSWTTMLIIVYSGLSVYYSVIRKKRMLLVISILCIAIQLFETGSKSLLASFAIVLCVYAFFKVKTLKKNRLFRHSYSP